MNGGINTSRNKQIITTITMGLLLVATLAIPALALTESEVEAQVASSGKEAVAGNVFIWLICAVAFLKVSQKIDSFLASLGVGVGRTGGSLLAEVLIATRGISAIRRTVGTAAGAASGRPSGSSQATGSFFKGGLAGIASRRTTSNAVRTATGNTAFHGVSSAAHAQQSTPQPGQPASPDTQPPLAGGAFPDAENQGNHIPSGATASERRSEASNMYAPHEPSPIATTGTAAATVGSDPSPYGQEGSTVIQPLDAAEPISAAGLHSDHAETGVGSHDETRNTAIPGVNHADVQIARPEPETRSDATNQTGSLTPPGEPTAIIGANPIPSEQRSGLQPDIQPDAAPISTSTDTSPVLGDSDTMIRQSQESESHTSAQNTMNAGHNIANHANVSNTAQTSVRSSALTNVNRSRESSRANTVHRSAQATTKNSFRGGEGPKMYGIGGRMFMKSLSRGGGFANDVIGRVARGDIQTTGTITGEMATHALNSYMGVTALGADAGAVPHYSNVEIGGGRISGVETAAGTHQDVQFCMYDASQYAAPQSEHTKVVTADGATWYKQYAQDAVDRKPYMAPDGGVAYNETIVKRMPRPPQRKSRM